MRTLLAIFFVLFCWQSAIAQGPEVRLWVSKFGDQYLKAKVVGVEDGVATLKDERDRLSEVNLSDLSNEDREYALQHAATVEDELPPPDPVPDEATSDEPVEKIKLPKPLRTLQRLLNAGKQQDESDDGSGLVAKPLFGDDSSVFIALSGDFLNEFIQVPVEENQAVSDVILGARVEGTAAMSGVATLMLRPSPTHASVEVVVSGKADTQTVGKQLVLNVHLSLIHI